MPHDILFAGAVSVTGSLADPPGASVLIAAVSWLEATLLGTVATTVAIIAVASVGLMMLMGRVNVRYGLTVIAGSFILFGASAIVAGIQASLGAGDFAAIPPTPPTREASALPQPPPPPAGYDPYAGASVPPR